ncbi:FAD-binding protein [Kitasatospora sp. NPDC058032]|uniref:FAD-binding protein n=1 Tax=unclassified Kitasatospora TaxID=2633591 RepID=UPI0033AD5375
MFNRRQILRYGAVATGAAALSGGLLSGVARAAEPVDVVIVGSGYAGSVAALRLAQAGFSSVLLERGRRWPITPAGDTFCTPQAPDGRAAWLATTSPFTNQSFHPFTGVLEAFVADGVIGLAGAGVGGGSLVNNAVMMAPREDFFRRSFGESLDYAEMRDVWYPRARGLIGVAPIPDDVLNSPYYANARDLLAEAARAGLPTLRPDMAVDWQIVRNEIAGTAVRSAILGHSDFGVNSGAKRSVDRSILATAEATGRVSVLPLHQVTDISTVDNRYLISAERIDEQGLVSARPQFAARYVFLAAGSLGTTRLLVRAKARGGLPKLGDQVGRNWGTGGDHIIVRAGLPLRDTAQGGPSHIVATDWADPETPVTFLGFPLGYPELGSLAGTMLGLSVPPALGRFDYRPATGKVELTWPKSDPRIQRVTDAMSATTSKLDRANPGIRVDVVTPALTAHCLGGVVLGKATGQAGDVLGYDNLFAIDSSLIPGSTGAVPPALTVTALADRCVDRALHRLTSSGPTGTVLALS